MTVDSTPPIVVVGAKYVGLVTAVGIARTREVRLVDVDQNLIENLEKGVLPIYEDGLALRFEEARPRLSFHTTTDGALKHGHPKLVFVAVGTPTRKGAEAQSDPPNAQDGHPPEQDDGAGRAADLEAVEGVVAKLSAHPGIAIVMKSTVSPGMALRLTERARENGQELTYLSCPEFLQEGRALQSFDEPDRVVVGRQEPSWASEALYELHRELNPRIRRCDPDIEALDPAVAAQAQRPDAPPMPIAYLEMDLTSAELVKHASNLHLATRVSYTNHIANLCEELGADVLRVMEGVGADARIGPQFLEPGVGFGGSCFGKDLRAISYVAHQAGIRCSIADSVLQINEEQAMRVVEKIERRLGGLRDARVAILGLTFKVGTDDLRGSPAFAIADALRERGATLRAWDPREESLDRAVKSWFDEKLGDERLMPQEVARGALDAMRDAHAVVLVTAWPEFEEIDWQEAAGLLKGRLVIDGRNKLCAESVRAAGLDYQGTGRESDGLSRRALLGSAAEG